MAEKIYYGGVEGGASRSSFTLMRSDGHVLANSSGESTNQYLIGVDGCLERIKQMVEDGLEKAGLPKDTTLEGLGMSLSGGDEKAVQEMIKDTIRSKYPYLARHLYVGSDTHSALATALPEGGVVLIAGTGSNCFLVNGDGSTARCGGLGHMIGDEGSACWITLKAIKCLVDHEDGLNISPHPVETVRNVIFSYFEIQQSNELLDPLYKNFDKTKFSGCCKHLAEAAIQNGDPLCCWLFKEAGVQLAKHLSAVAQKAEKHLLERQGGIPIVCVGSVFKSWNLLQPGFESEMKSRFAETSVKEATLIRLTTDASVGAAALGAKAAGKVLPVNYPNTSTVFHQAAFHPEA